MRFSPSFIERLRAHFLMSEVVGKRLPLKKHGREYHGLCPFHNEKTPSFTVNDAKAFFHCFGCGAHGDAIEFVRRIDRLSYPEAIEQLAREAGIPLPVDQPEERRKIEQEKTLHDVLEAACQWFEKQLVAFSGETARDYIERRGIKPETVRRFRLGYAPDERNGLHKHLLGAGFTQPLQADAGLIIVPDNGGAPYDRFRGRIMFPIRNASGKVIAFGGRLIVETPGKSLPKYLNSPETAVFKKGELLYNLDLAKKPSRERNLAVVMEGYMDVVSTAQTGVDYAVATLGTAVTPEHLRLLWQLAKEPVLCLDGDAAGKRAMLRAAHTALPLLKAGYSLRFAMLPKGEDPDSYIQKHGKAAFEKTIAASQRLSQALWDSLLPQYDIRGPEGRAALEDACKKLADLISDATVKHHYLSYFRKQLWEKSNTKLTVTPERSPSIEHFVRQDNAAALDILIRRLLRTLLHFPQLLHKSDIEETLSRLTIEQVNLASARDVLLHVSHRSECDDAVQFQALVQQDMPEELFAPLMHEQLHLPYLDTSTIEDAALLWQETVFAYQIAHLEWEMHALQTTMGANIDEEGYRRLIELKQTINHAMANKRFAPEETDNVG